MKVIYQKLPSKRVSCVAAIGVFDGVHRGHQFILHRLKKSAKQKNFSSLVISFDLAPQQFLRKAHLHNVWHSTKIFSGCLTDLAQKVKLFDSFDIDYLWFLKTSRALLEFKPADFLRYIFRYFAIKEIMVGADFKFGYAGGGGVAYLKKAAHQFGFKLTVVSKKKTKTDVISSSLIRDYIRRAELSKVKQLLGREFSLRGKVVKGRGLGSALNFPTANILTGDYVVPARGVYAAYVVYGGKKYLAAVNIGSNPTISTAKKYVVEAHIIKFNKNILTKTIEIIFLHKIRNERKFLNRSLLQAAIQKDIAQIAAKYSIPY